jgi:hypothetical protein
MTFYEVAMDFSKTVVIKKTSKSYTAQFSLEGGLIKVIAKGPDGIMTSMSTQATGNVNAKMMARVLLTEMIKAGRVIPD